MTGDKLIHKAMVNTLVTHKKLRSLGIGCISKELSKSYKVNFGLDDVLTCKKTAVEIVDTSACKTVSFQEFRTRILKDNSELNNAIVGNELKHYVGIGWVTDRVVTMADLQKYPRVI
jgi:hypothetical protein